MAGFNECFWRSRTPLKKTFTWSSCLSIPLYAFCWFSLYISKPPQLALVKRWIEMILSWLCPWGYLPHHLLFSLISRCWFCFLFVMIVLFLNVKKINVSQQLLLKPLLQCLAHCLQRINIKNKKINVKNCKNDNNKQKIKKMPSTTAEPLARFEGCSLQVTWTWKKRHLYLCLVESGIFPLGRLWKVCTQFFCRSFVRSTLVTFHYVRHY